MWFSNSQKVGILVLHKESGLGKFLNTDQPQIHDPQCKACKGVHHSRL